MWNRRVRLQSLQARLALRIGVLFAVFYAAFAAVTAFGLLEVSETARMLSLHRQSERLLEAIRVGDGGALTIASSDRMSRFYAPGGQAGFYVLWDSGGRALASSDPNMVDRLRHAVGVPPRPGQADTEEQDGADQAIYAYTRALHDLGAFLTVGRRTITDDIILDDVERGLIWNTALIGVPLFLATLVISLATIRSMLRPISAVSRMAVAISPSSSDVRLPEAGLPSEVMPLIRAANHALERLDAANQMQRSFTADAAHQLRTPLAIITARVSEFQGYPRYPDLRGDIARMTRLVGQLLNLARVDANPMEHHPVDLCLLAERIAAVMAPLAVRAGKEVALASRCDSALVFGDEDVLEEAVSNLVDNAIRHTARGTAVEIEVDQPACIRVSDRGPGVAPEARHRLFQRFNQAAGSTGGTGLGLAIAFEIARRHDGQVSYHERAGGGAVFALCVGPANMSRNC